MKKLLPVLFFLTSIILISCGDNGAGPEETRTYTINVSVAPSDGGSVSPGTNQTYEEGETAELEATANEDYMFTGWSGDAESSDNPLSLTVDQDYDLTANFDLKNYELTINTEGEGNVSEQVVESKVTDYDHGTVVELTATPDSGWKFVEWQGDITGTDNPATVTVDEEKEVTAVFSAFYLADNGVTIMCPEAEVGASGDVNGTTYTKRTAGEIMNDSGLAATACTSGITSMFNMFNGKDTFNDDISHWDVSSVTSMGWMFHNAETFNQPVGKWDVSSVTNMVNMFFNATAFDQPIDNWDVSSVTDMAGMFYRADNFNQPIDSWDTGSVTRMEQLFNQASSFNQPIGSWDTGNVTNMDLMFFGAHSFDQDLSGWCVEEITVEPTDFSTSAPLTNAHKPVWGTCP